MDFLALDKFLESRLDNILCVPAGVDDDKTFYPNIIHKTSPKLATEDIEQIAKIVTQESQLIEFFKHYGSIELYCDTLSDASGYYIAHPSHWSELQEEFYGWVNDLTENESPELLPDWLQRSLVIGEKTASSNYYLMIIEGNGLGKIFEFEHDGFEFNQISDDFYMFIERLITLDDERLKDLSAHVRYSDGKTDTQWMPVSCNYG